MGKIFVRVALAGLLLATAGLAVFRPAPGFSPAIDIEAPDSAGTITLRFLFDDQPSQKQCEMVTGSVARTTLKTCRGCRITRMACDATLSSEERDLFSEAPIDQPSGRMANGVVVFLAADPATSLATCRDTESQSAKNPYPVKCYPAKTERPALPGPTPLNVWSPVVLAIAFLCAWLVGWLIVRYEHLHASFSYDHVGSGPQKYHAHPTPRIGGVAVLMGLVGAGSVMLFADAIPVEQPFGLLLLAGVPAFLGGLIEDVTKKVGVFERLLLTMLSGAAAAWLLGAVLDRLDIPGIDRALALLPLAVAFTVFAVGGVANAVNIIDGYNGLAGGFAVIVLAAIAFVSCQVGDALVFNAALALLGAILGFLVWNWPGGKIFLGDGGAYLVGFFLAELSVLLVLKNPHVSPWFPVLLLIYPIFETFYSIYRRRLQYKLSPGLPDNQHLHQLVHDRLIPHRKHGGPFSRNSQVAKYIWIPAGAMGTLGTQLIESTSALAACIAAFCVFYVMFYRSLAGQRPPAAATVISAVAATVSSPESIDSPPSPQA